MNPTPLPPEIPDDTISQLKNTFVERRDESATVLRAWLEAEGPQGAGAQRGAA
jgi:hypothetical protein